MKMEELQHALAVNFGDESFDRENIASKRSLLDYCLGLVIVDEESNYLRLVHKSLYDYLMTQKDRLFENGHSEIAGTCLTYMNFKVSAQLGMRWSDPYGVDQQLYDLNLLSRDFGLRVGATNASKYETQWDEIHRFLESSAPLDDNVPISYDFLRYAIFNWGHHAKEGVNEVVENLALALLSKPVHSRCISQG
jgi:uncharacterized protein YozE (UPF0346 family)